MYASAQAAAAETPPGPNAHLVDDFHKIGITESQLHLWASRGPVGGAKEAPLLSAEAVKEAASARRGGTTAAAAAATAATAGETLRSASPLVPKRAGRLLEICTGMAHFFLWTSLPGLPTTCALFAIAGGLLRAP